MWSLSSHSQITWRRQRHCWVFFMMAKRESCNDILNYLKLIKSLLNRKGRRLWKRLEECLLSKSRMAQMDRRQRGLWMWRTGTAVFTMTRVRKLRGPLCSCSNSTIVKGRWILKTCLDVFFCSIKTLNKISFYICVLQRRKQIAPFPCLTQTCWP